MGYGLIMIGRTKCPLIIKRGVFTIKVIAFFIFLFVLTCAIVLPIAEYTLRRDKKRLKSFISKNKITPFQTDYFVDGNYIIYDNRDCKVWIYNPKKNTYFCANTRDITGCEMRIDNSTEFRTSMFSTAGRAIVGGAIAGGLGAIIGGVTAKQTGKKMVDKIELLISFDNMSSPYRTITVLDSTNGVSINSFDYKDNYDKAMHWCKLFERLSDR
ncbi:hypothetical protein [Bacillus sp. S0628]|uniref:hypothetical protein n=1 Tax=Bacillus sp. S0628 TaxID=2957802 RepID=UPI00209D3C0F|nr:hypothetical protein [Bacillus sp. S0628]MCP1324340.1 hypothetical protein [Bacillus sp. S0628]